MRKPRALSARRTRPEVRARLPETKPHTGRQTSTSKQQLDALLEYAVMHGDESEAARLRAELTKLVEKV